MPYYGYHHKCTNSGPDAILGHTYINVLIAEYMLYYHIVDGSLNIIP